MSLLERALIAAASLALSVGLIALLSGFFASHDPASITGSVGPGVAFRDLGDRLLGPGDARPRYDSSPPTSGAHGPARVTHDGVTLTDDQLLEALAAGDIVIAFEGRRPSRPLVALARSLAAPFTPALAAAGQAVVLDRIRGTRGLIGLAWAHLVRVGGVADPRLREFVSYWLGRGAALSGP